MQPHVMLQRTLTDTSPSLFCPLSNICKGQQSFNSELKQLLALNRGLTKSIGDFFFLKGQEETEQCGAKTLLTDSTGAWPHLDLVLLSCVFNRLENVPRAPASHLQPSHVLTVPALDQQSCSDRW